MTLPGTSLLSLLKRCLDDESTASPIVSTIADLQHEALAADTTWQRWLAVLRGYAGVARLLFVDRLIWRFPMRSILTVATLGIAGAAASVAAFWGRVGGTDGGVLLVFLAMAVITPLVIRRAAVGRSYRGMLLACIAVGMIMGTALFVWVALVSSPGVFRWRGVLWRYLFLAGCVVLASALASAAAWKPIASPSSAWASRIRIVLISAAVCALYFAVTGTVSLLGRGVVFGQMVRGWFSALLFAFYFAGIAVAVYLPVLEGVKALVPRWNRQLPLAVIGAALFPIPPVAIAFFSGRLAVWWQYYLQHPTSTLALSLAYVIAGAVLGWLLAEQSRRSRVTAS